MVFYGDENVIVCLAKKFFGRFRLQTEDNILVGMLDWKF